MPGRLGDVIQVLGRLGIGVQIRAIPRLWAGSDTSNSVLQFPLTSTNLSLVKLATVSTSPESDQLTLPRHLRMGSR